MKRILLFAAASVALGAAQPAAAATNLIANGGFDAPGNFSGDYQTITESTTPLGFGWSVNGSVDVFKTDSFIGGDPDPVGGDPYALDLVGTGTYGGIYQSFNTEIGKLYRLTFDFANNPFISGASMNVGVSSLGGLSFLNEVAHSGSTPTAMDWQTYTYEFTALAGTSTLFFNNASGGVNGGMYLDNISIIDPAAVPEPATWALMIAGFGLAGTALRQRRRLMPTAV
jgi:hypothetical protein